jgi:hypothetical protein
LVVLAVRETRIIFGREVHIPQVLETNEFCYYGRSNECCNVMLAIHRPLRDDNRTNEREPPKAIIRSEIMTPPPSITIEISSFAALPDQFFQLLATSS